MTAFAEFPRNMQFTPVPVPFLNVLAPQMDALELKIMLYVFQSIYAKKGTLRYTSIEELLANPALATSLKHEGKHGTGAVKQALNRAAEMGALIVLETVRDERDEQLYFINSAADRLTVARLRAGVLKLPQTDVLRPATPPETPPDIFSIYEENIGMLTPMVAEELKDALGQYSEDWIRDAIREAVNNNKRSWRYIQRILERWTAEGKKDGLQQRDTQHDPEKYLKGRYGHLIKH